MFVHRRWRMDRSGGLRHAARVAAGIVRCRFDRGGRQWLRCVGKQLARIVGNRRIWIDARDRFRQWVDHGMSQPARRAEYRSIADLTAWPSDRGPGCPMGWKFDEKGRESPVGADVPLEERTAWSGGQPHGQAHQVGCSARWR
jgi:hypothetical protein